MIGAVRNNLLRRALLLAYLPVFVLLGAMILLAGYVYQIAILTHEQCRDFVWDEIKDCWRLFRRTWAQADA